MLSILIPVYNYKCTGLVADLRQQALQLGCPYEIIVMDDGSSQYVSENMEINRWAECRFIRNERNGGRSVVRNRLGEEARYDTLLFMDCDARVVSESFLETYRPYFGLPDVICGGCCCTDKIPELRYRLRWTYGRACESKNAATKRESHFQSFSAFNFLIGRELFLSVRFDESIATYGHEDILFGLTLRAKGANFSFIDNPLFHDGLDDNDIFLRKTNEAVETMYKLYKSGNYQCLLHTSKLYTVYHFLCRMRFSSLTGCLFKLFRSCMIRQLCGLFPSMRLYQLYKIGYICTLPKN